MAARLTKRVTENHRSAIQTSMLIKRLQDHVVGDVELSQTQVRSAQFLINQAIGAPTQTNEIAGKGGAPLTVGIVRLSDADSQG